MDRGLIVTIAISAAMASFLTYFGYMRYEAFRMNACGMGIYLQSLYNFCSGRPFYNTINGNLLFWRFEPILILLAPIFCFLKSPLVLIASQALAVSATLPLVYLLARSLIKRPLLFTLLFLMSPVFVGLGLYDFSTVSFSAPLLFSTLIALERRKLKAFLALSLLFLMTSSVASLTLISIGFFLSARFDKERRLWGDLLMLVGGLGLLITVLIMQRLNPDWLWYRASHVDPFFQRRLLVVGVMLIHFLFIPLFTIEGSLSLLPLLTIALLYKNVPYFFIGTYMPAPLYLLISVISLYTISVLRLEGIIKYALALSVPTFVTFNPFYPVVTKFDFIVYYAFPKVEEHQLLLRELISKLPDVPTVVQSNLFTHLYYRNNVYVDYKEGVKLAVMDSSSMWYPYIAAALLLREDFKNSCELFNTPISQIVKLLSKPSPFVERYEREFKVALAFDNIIVASKEKVSLNVRVPKGVTGIFFKDVTFKRKALVMPVLRLFLDWKGWSPYVTVPADKFSAVFEGKLRLGRGTYTFYVQSDDGSWMRLGNNTIFNCLHTGPCFDVAVIKTNGGDYSYTIKYVEYVGNAKVKVYYKKEGWRGFAYLNSTVER